MRSRAPELVEKWPSFKPSGLLEALTSNGVDFVVIGGFAAIAQGSARLTNDLDIRYSPEPQNLQTLGRTLNGLRARLRGVADDVPFAPTSRPCGERRCSLWTPSSDRSTF